MRDRKEIEREMFEARQDLEENLDRLVHRAREQVQVRARATHALRTKAREHLRLFAIVAVGVMTAIAVVVFHRVRGRAVDHRTRWRAAHRAGLDDLERVRRWRR